MIRHNVAALLTCIVACNFALADDSKPLPQEPQKVNILSSEERADQILKLLATAEKLHKLGHLQGARDKYSEVLAMAATPQPLSLLRRGICHEALGERESAKADFVAVTKISYANSEILEEAKDNLKKAAFKLSEEDQVTIDVSDYLIQQGERTLEEVLKLNPENLAHLTPLAEAATQLDAIKTRLPEHAPTILRLGHIYDLAGLPVSARGHYQSYLQLYNRLGVLPGKTELKVRARLLQIAKEQRPETKTEIRWYERNGRKVAGKAIPASSPAASAIRSESTVVERMPTDDWTPFTKKSVEVTTTEPSYWKVTASARFRGHPLTPQFAMSVNCDGMIGLVAQDGFGPGADNLLCTGTVLLPAGKHTFDVMGSMPTGNGLSASNPYEIEGWRLDIEPIFPSTCPVDLTVESKAKS